MHHGGWAEGVQNGVEWLLGAWRGKEFFYSSIFVQFGPLREFCVQLHTSFPFDS